MDNDNSTDRHGGGAVTALVDPRTDERLGMNQRTGGTMLGLAVTSMIWAIAMLGFTASTTSVAVAGGLSGMSIATLAAVLRPSTWRSTQHAIDRNGRFVAYVPAVAGFAVGTLVALLVVGVTTLIGIGFPAAAALPLGGLGGLIFAGWSLSLFEVEMELDMQRTLAAGPTPAALTSDSGQWSPKAEIDQPYNYRGNLVVEYEPGFAGVIGTLTCRFLPTADEPPVKQNGRTRFTSVQVDDGVDADSVPFMVRVVTHNGLRSVPGSARLVVPVASGSTAQRFNLLKPTDDRSATTGPEVATASSQMVLTGLQEWAASYAGQEVELEVLQGERRVQVLRFSIPDQEPAPAMSKVTGPPAGVLKPLQSNVLS